MQQHIKTYYDKVQEVLASRMSSSNGKKKKSKGLLSPSKNPTTNVKERDQLEIIADIIQGIREAKEEILNARK